MSRKQGRKLIDIMAYRHDGGPDGGFDFRRTDRQTDRLMDGQTFVIVESLSQLKKYRVA